MKRILFLAAVLCLSTVAAFSQGKPTDFSGGWVLDIPQSQISERMRIESMTMTVAQTDKELKVTTETRRPAPPAEAAQATPGAPGRGRGGFGGDGTVAYSLDGKESVVEVDGPNGKMPIKYTGKIDGGKANLSSSRSISGPQGELTVTTKDVWSLSPDGKTLTVVREQVTPRGTNSSTLVFVKK
ncbi:MAG TPA: hypothetical protein VNA22_03290 [Pyrinomonadaceae bacterium]|nr:hypothetical protein [Pyrinomonadaceae bacterium]